MWRAITRSWFKPKCRAAKWVEPLTPVTLRDPARLEPTRSRRRFHRRSNPAMSDAVPYGQSEGLLKGYGRPWNARMVLKVSSILMTRLGISG